MATATVLYPKSPIVWGQPHPVPELPSAALTIHPATPVMWQGRLDAREARLRELPGEVMGALASNPQ